MERFSSIMWEMNACQPLAQIVTRLVWVLVGKKLENKNALQKYRAECQVRALQERRIQQAWIPGIGSLVRARLADHGITSAYEVSLERLLAIRGLGEATIKALLRWRAAQEHMILATLPRKLPSAQDQAHLAHSLCSDLACLRETISTDWTNHPHT